MNQTNETSAQEEYNRLKEEYAEHPERSLDGWARRALPVVVRMIDEMPRTKASGFIVQTLYDSIGQIANYLGKLDDDELQTDASDHASFHRLWTMCAKRLEQDGHGYDKTAWMLVENQLVQAGIVGKAKAR